MSTFKGQALSGKRKTRGVIDANEEAQVFLELYSQFYEQLESMDEAGRELFIEKANEVYEGFGGGLASGDKDDM